MDVMVVGLVEAWWRVWRVVGGGRVVVGGLSCGSVALFCVPMTFRLEQSCTNSISPTYLRQNVPTSTQELGAIHGFF
jgi:hypothetical protein